MPHVWINQVGGCNNGALLALATPIGNFSVIECKNAIYHRNDRIRGQAQDWYIVGNNCGGVGYNVLWLYGQNGGVFTPMEAWTQFSRPSSAIAFVMDGDDNDGFAEFLVDGHHVGSFDLYNLGEKALVVDGLQFIAHKLEVKLTGKNNPNSNGFDAHIYGGLALA